MKVTVAKTAGFCFGVKRAVEMTYAEAKKERKVFTLGPIIHNEKVVEDLEAKGVFAVDRIEDLPEGENITVVIRSHGVGKDIYDAIEKKGVHMVDATCPFVARIHETVRKASEEGKHIIVIGSRNHPEVQGILGWCSTPAEVIETEEEARAWEPVSGLDYQIVSQTTFHANKFKVLLEILKEKRYDISAINSICNATTERQREAEELAGRSDAMVVIGGKSSSNTQKLYEICRGKCQNAFYIQTLVDLDLSQFQSYCSVGITAGASTPDHIIKEVHDRMSEMSFAELLEGEELVTIHNGEVVEGIVDSVKEDQIVLNIHYKADGIITRSEYTNDASLDLTTFVKPGDTMQAKVLQVNDGEGQVKLSYRRLAAERGNKILEEAFENGTVVTAKVADVLTGGLSVNVEGARVFIPASLVSDSYEKNLGKYKDQEIEFVVTEFNPKRRRVIGDRKQLLVAKKKELQDALFARIEPGMTVTGTVKNVTDFGAFIDLGGADGLLHISEMSWGRVENPKKVFKVGEEVEVLIKDIQGEKIALSMKFPEKNPWLNADQKYAVGNVVEGRVARMTDFGAFIELEVGVDALLHVSQISREHVDKPSDVLKVNEVVSAKVVDFDADAKKISLSMKALEAPAKKAEEELAYSDDDKAEE